jgi:acetyl-CoA carboxylase carboxyl transferase subunit alpha
MFEMAKLKVPVIAIVIGEGSSGGALALGVANKVFMLENSVYSILSPEGYSSILWKDSSRYKEAAEKMKLTAEDLYKLKIIDKIIEEPLQVGDNEFNDITQRIKKEIQKEISKMKKMSKEEIVENRYKKFRKISGFMEV